MLCQSRIGGVTWEKTACQPGTSEGAEERLLYQGEGERASGNTGSAPDQHDFSTVDTITDALPSPSLFPLPQAPPPRWPSPHSDQHFFFNFCFSPRCC